MTTDDLVAAPAAPPTIYCVMVDCPLERAVSHLQALEFCRALLASSHSLLGVFYYGDAVAILDSDHAPDLREQWCRLLGEAGVEGVVCIAAATRRALTDQRGAPLTPPPPPLRLGGLGEWVGWSVRAQRVVRFA